MAEKKKTKTEKKAGGKKAPKRGKRFAAAEAVIKIGKPLALAEAIALLKSAPKTKFDETVDIAINLGIDPAQSDQNVRGIVPMPNGVGKTIRVAVFARDKSAEEAKKAGADIVGAEDLVEAIKKGAINFDRCIATPDMMGLVGSVAKILGPRGLMPNPKLGTVTPKVGDAVKTTKSGQVEFRTEKNGIIHAGVGKISFSEKALEENIRALIGAVRQLKPADLKGHYLKKVSLSTTMSPSIKIELNSLSAAA